MSFNNTSNVLNPKRNLRRANRLQNNGNFTPFDNAGFEDEKDNNSRADKNMPTSQSPLPVDEKRKRFDENKSRPHRRLPECKPPPSNSRGSSGLGTNAPRRGTESIELQGGIKSQQETRKVLESINVLPCSNNQVPASTDGERSPHDKDPASPNSENGKASKSLLLSNLKRFEAATKGNTQIQDRLRAARPSLAAAPRSGWDFVDMSNFSRSCSMREGKAKLKPPRKLLRDISFSDTDQSVTMDYGALKNVNLPRRHVDEPISVDTIVILESLMQELTKRGKVHHVAVLDRKESKVLASVPSGLLTTGDAIGMTKSIVCPPTLFKLKIGKHEYSCFKHRQDAVQGRAPELVMVMQMTETCVVVGFSRDDKPGSCNSEVHEFTKVLEEAGW